jgi:Uma2 family endonuclease
MNRAPTPVMTLDEYFELPETNSRIDELLDGAYFVTPTPSFLHQRAVLELGFSLSDHLAEHPGLVVFPIPGNIVLGPRTVVTPDIFVIPRPPSVNVSWREVERPLLVAEVPETSTAARDRGIKRQLYQQAGVPEYWIVDLDARLMERWLPADDRPEILTERLIWQPPGSSEPFEVDLSRFFAKVLES